MTPPTNAEVQAARERLEERVKEWPGSFTVRSDQVSTILAALAAAEKRVATLERAMQPLSGLGAILTGKERDDAVFVGQVRDGVHHPITFGDLRRAAALTSASAGRTDGGA